MEAKEPATREAPAYPVLGTTYAAVAGNTMVIKRAKRETIAASIQTSPNTWILNPKKNAKFWDKKFGNPYPKRPDAIKLVRFYLRGPGVTPYQYDLPAGYDNKCTVAFNSDGGLTYDCQATYNHTIIHASVAFAGIVCAVLCVVMRYAYPERTRAQRIALLGAGVVVVYLAVAGTVEAVLHQRRHRLHRRMREELDRQADNARARLLAQARRERPLRVKDLKEELPRA